MFKFFKDKLKDVVNKFSKKVEEEAEEQVAEEPKADEKIKEEPKKIKEIIEEKQYKESEKEIKKKEKPKLELKEEKPEPKKGDAREEIKNIIEEEVKDSAEPKKKGFFRSIKEIVTTKKINEEQFDELFWELELVLMENNVASEVVEKIKQDLKMDLVDQPINRGDISGTIKESLKKSIEEVLDFKNIDLLKKIKESEKPFVIIFFGINGSGKTTTIAKVANLCLNNKLKVVLGAADSFRSAAIEQLEEWGKKLNVRVIKHSYGADPAAICFDTISYAKSHGVDVVLIDTAGRQHSNTNLMEEMKKIVKVSKPNMKIFLGESTTGNDCIEQIRKFDKTVGIDAIILSKADVDEKGGTALSISFVSGKPVIYLGTGQKYGDLKEFDKQDVIKNLGLG